MNTSLKRTPLYDEHIKLKARLVPFGGWEMPVQYSGLMQEHEAVRRAAGLFDVSHMGEFLVHGPKAQEFLMRVLSNDIAKIEVGGCQYTPMCYENGTVVDDLIVSRAAPDFYFLVVNAGNTDKDFAWLSSHKPDGVTLENVSDAYALIALQGPQSEAILQAFFNQPFSSLTYYHFRTLDGSPAFFKDRKLSTTLISRTGYTGEDGFEILVPKEKALATWQRLLQVGKSYGLVPAGLGARDTLRLEAAYALYGHEINDTITALEAKLGWVVKFDKPDFVGKEALLKEKQAGSARRLMGFELTESAIAREGYAFLSPQGESVGFVTSGTHSPTLKTSIGLALIRADVAQIGNELKVDVRGKPKSIRLVKTPFYQRA